MKTIRMNLYKMDQLDLVTQEKCIKSVAKKAAELSKYRDNKLTLFLIKLHDHELYFDSNGELYYRD